MDRLSNITLHLPVWSGAGIKNTKSFNDVIIKHYNSKLYKCLHEETRTFKEAKESLRF